MKKTQKNFFALFAAMFVAANVNAHSSASPYFSIRSQGENLAREQVGWEDQINLFDMESIYGAFYIAPHYSQTFRENRLANCIFGDDLDCSDCGGVLKIQGSCVANRDEKAWLADYFGLPTNYDGTITFRPRIRNFVVDLGFYLGLDEVASGMYLQVNLPITHTRWNLRYSEDRTVPSSSVTANNHDAGYFTSDTVPAANLLTNAVDFFTGNAVPTLENCDGSNVKFNALDCCKWAQECGGCDGKDSGDLTKTRPADIEFILGWNFLRDEDYHMGLGVRFTAPTGNTPKGEYLFEPMVGNGGHWTLGGRFSTHAIMWRSEDEERSFGFYLDANISHLFDECQTRCFDLCGKPNSRYALAMKLADNDSDALAGNPAADTSNDNDTNSTKVFANEYTSVANLTKSNVDVSASIQGDIAFKFAYVSGGFSWDLGYNFYGRSCEDICRKSGCPEDDITNWALKGDSHVYGYLTGTGETCEDAARPLAATQSGSDIHKGLNRTTGSCSGDELRNPNVDNAQFALSGGTVLTAVLNQPPANQTRTSTQPVNLTIDDLDLRGTKIISHKLYTNISYAWIDNEDWTPFLGIGAEVEFHGNDCGDCEDNCKTSCTTSTSCKTSCDDDCDDCKKCGANQWGVWIKGGIAFN